MAKKPNPHRNRPPHTSELAESAEQLRRAAITETVLAAKGLLARVMERYPDDDGYVNPGKNVCCDYSRDLAALFLEGSSSDETDADSLFASLILNDGFTVEAATEARDAALFLRDA